MTPEELSTIRLRLLLNTVLLCAFSYAVWEGRQFVAIAGRLPIALGIAGMVAAAISLVFDGLLLRRKDALVQIPTDVDSGASPEAEGEAVWVAEGARGYIGVVSSAKWFVWIFVLLVLLTLLGMAGGSIVFLALFLTREAGMRLRAVAVVSAVLVAVLLLASEVAGLNFMDGKLLPGLLGLDRVWDALLG